MLANVRRYLSRRHEQQKRYKQPGVIGLKASRGPRNKQ